MNSIDKMKNGFTIGIPTWNRLDFLKCCIDSILKNSYYNYKHEIRVHINGCTDGTKEYLDKMCSLYENIKYTYSQTNLGIVEGHNMAIANGTKPFIIMPDNDIFFFPNWDLELVKFAEENGANETWWLNPMPVEPHGSNICCIAPKNYGLTPKQFNYKQALTDMHILQATKAPLNSNCTPICLWRETFEKIGGLNKDLEIGIGLEDDLAIRYYRETGCRNFVVVPRSLVYHFQAGITGFQTCENRDHYANLRDIYFREKYNTTKEEFLFKIIKRGKQWVKK